MFRQELRWNDFKNAFEERWMFENDIRAAAINLAVRDVHAHWHSEIEVLMVIGGEITVGVSSEIYYLAPGDCLIIPSGTTHYIHSKYALGRASILIFSPSIFADNNDALNAYDVPLITRELGLGRFQELYESIRSEISHADEGYMLVIKSLLGLLSGWIIRILKNEKSIKQQLPFHDRKTDLERLFKYIEDNFTKKVNLDEAAQILHFNKSYFCRYFKKHTGMNFVEFINSMRVQEAKSLLASTNSSVMEIAFKCGFTNVRTFNREFKRIVGMTATKYKHRDAETQINNRKERAIYEKT